jgi:hypothetical protein
MAAMIQRMYTSPDSKVSRSIGGGRLVSLSFLIGAILGSFIAIAAGRQPARKLIAVMQDRYYRGKK